MLINFLVAPIINLSFIFCQNFPQMLLFRAALTIQNAFQMPAATALLADIIPRESRGRAIAAIGWQPVILSISVGMMASGFFRFPPNVIGSALSGYLFDLDIRLPWFLLAAAYALEFLICFFFIKEPEKPAD